MNMVALLIGLGPLLGWGLFPTVASKIGGRPVNQIIGTALGTFVFAFLYSVMNQTAFPEGIDLLFSIVSGIGWASAQIITFKSFSMIGSSRAMPITTAFQLLGASLWGVIALGNWPGVTAKLLGSFALALIILGAWLTVWSEEKNEENSQLLRKAVMMLAIGEIGYWAYSAAPQATAISGQESFLPQAVGMLLVAIIYAVVLRVKEKEEFALLEIVSYKQMISGFFFAFAALTYLISAQPDMNGLATGFVLSQTSVVLATLTGIFILKQKKSHKEMIVTMIGLACILLAATITVMI